MASGARRAQSTCRLVLTFAKNILREYHDTPFSGHLGMDKLLQGVSKDFWWPHQRDDVADYVRTCDSCQRNKPLNRAPAGLLQPLPTPQRNWEQITMDLITGLPTTSEGHDTILLILDRMSKMIHCAPTRKTITGPGLADLVVTNVFRYHGLPRTIISDRDPRTTSNFWRALLSTLGTKLRVSTAFHPQTDGQTERANRTLEEMLPLCQPPPRQLGQAPTPHGVCLQQLRAGLHQTDAILPQLWETPSATCQPGRPSQSRCSNSASPGAALEGHSGESSGTPRQITGEADPSGQQTSHPSGVPSGGPSSTVQTQPSPWQAGRRVAVFHASLLKPYKGEPPTTTPSPTSSTTNTNAPTPSTPPSTASDLSTNGHPSSEFQAEAILKRRRRKIGDKTVEEFLIKWRDRSNQDNLWMPVVDVDPGLLTNFRRLPKDLQY